MCSWSTMDAFYKFKWPSLITGHLYDEDAQDAKHRTPQLLKLPIGFLMFITCMQIILYLITVIFMGHMQGFTIKSTHKMCSSYVNWDRFVILSDLNLNIIDFGRFTAMFIMAHFWMDFFGIFTVKAATQNCTYGFGVKYHLSGHYVMKKVGETSCVWFSPGF